MNTFIYALYDSNYHIKGIYNSKEELYKEAKIMKKFSPKHKFFCATIPAPLPSHKK